MGKRGPKPQPLEIAEQNGSWRARTAEAKNAADNIGGVPDKPGNLSAAASELWDHYLPILEAMRVIAVRGR